jgi:hypothetical protein
MTFLFLPISSILSIFILFLYSVIYLYIALKAIHYELRRCAFLGFWLLAFFYFWGRGAHEMNGL